MPRKVGYDLGYDDNDYGEYDDYDYDDDAVENGDDHSDIDGYAGRNKIHKEMGSVTLTQKTRLAESTKIESGRYRPPHLRKREGTSTNSSKSWDARTFSDHETSVLGFTSSDSEHSDSDGSGKDMDYFRSSKARIAAIICVQDIC